MKTATILVGMMMVALGCNGTPHRVGTEPTQFGRTPNNILNNVDWVSKPKCRDIGGWSNLPPRSTACVPFGTAERRPEGDGWVDVEIVYDENDVMWVDCSGATPTPEVPLFCKTYIRMGKIVTVCYYGGSGLHGPE